MEDQTPLGGDEELRAEKYSDKDRKQGADEGWAMPDGSYPIKDAEDLDNAIHAVGRGNASHDAIRKHIIARANALGLSKEIPDNWNADGSLKQTNAALTKAAERRRKERHRAVALAREFRFRELGEVEVRREAHEDTDIITIRGSAIVYDAPYVVRDMFGEFEETMRPGCVTDLLARGVDCRFLHNHEGMALARTTSGTLDLIDTSRSLDIVARLDARQQKANDLAIALERGDENQMSIGMIVGRDSWGDDGAMETRDVYGLDDLLDVSQVTYPCSPTTHLEVAKRMAFAMPLETRARLRQMEVELRAGKALSADNQSKLVAALSALHDLASSGGVDLSSLDPDHDGDIDTAPDAGADLEPDVNVSDDATTGGNDTAESGVGADGFPADQTRAAEPGEPIQYLAKAAVDQAWLDSLIERGESQHGSARKRAA